jgi:hypothetical protein
MFKAYANEFQHHFDRTSKAENQNNLVFGCSRAESYNLLTKTQNLVTPKRSGRERRGTDTSVEGASGFAALDSSHPRPL